MNLGTELDINTNPIINPYFTGDCTDESGALELRVDTLIEGSDVANLSINSSSCLSNLRIYNDVDAEHIVLENIGDYGAHFSGNIEVIGKPATLSISSMQGAVFEDVTLANVGKFSFTDKILSGVSSGRLDWLSSGNGAAVKLSNISGFEGEIDAANIAFEGGVEFKGGLVLSAFAKDPKYFGIDFRKLHKLSATNLNITNQGDNLGIALSGLLEADELSANSDTNVFISKDAKWQIPNANIQAIKGISNQASITGADKISLQADEIVTFDEIKASQLELKAGSKLEAEKALSGSDYLHIDNGANAQIKTQGDISGYEIKVRGGKSFSAFGKLLADHVSLAELDQFILNNDIKANSVKVDVNNFYVKGKAKIYTTTYQRLGILHPAQGIEIKVKEQITAESGSSITSGAGLSIEGGRANIGGALLAQKDLQIDLTNKGHLSSLAKMVSAEGLLNVNTQGSLNIMNSVSGSLGVNIASAYNLSQLSANSVIESQNGKVALSSSAGNTRIDGRVQAKQGIELRGTSLHLNSSSSLASGTTVELKATNKGQASELKGRIEAEGDVDIEAQGLINSYSTVLSNGFVSMTSKQSELRNKGDINADGSITLAAQTYLEQQGNLKSKSTVALKCAERSIVLNSGSKIEAKSGFSVEGKTGFSQVSGAYIHSEGPVNIVSGSYENSGAINASGHIDIKCGSYIQSSSGVTKSSQGINVSASNNTIHKGLTEAQGNIIFNSDGSVEVYRDNGHVAAKGAVKLSSSNGYITLYQGAKVHGYNGVEIFGDGVTLYERAEVKSDNNKVNILSRWHTSIASDAKVSSKGYGHGIAINSTYSTNVQGKLLSKGGLKIKSGRGISFENAFVALQGKATLIAGSSDEITISKDTKFNAKALEVYSQAGKVSKFKVKGSEVYLTDYNLTSFVKAGSMEIGDEGTKKFSLKHKSYQRDTYNKEKHTFKRTRRYDGDYHSFVFEASGVQSTKFISNNHKFEIDTKELIVEDSLVNFQNTLVFKEVSDVKVLALKNIYKHMACGKDFGYMLQQKDLCWRFNIENCKTASIDFSGCIDKFNNRDFCTILTKGWDRFSSCLISIEHENIDRTYECVSALLSESKYYNDNRELRCAVNNSPFSNSILYAGNIVGRVSDVMLSKFSKEMPKLGSGSPSASYSDFSLMNLGSNNVALSNVQSDVMVFKNTGLDKSLDLTIDKRAFFLESGLDLMHFVDLPNLDLSVWDFTKPENLLEAPNVSKAEKYALSYIIKLKPELAEFMEESVDIDKFLSDAKLDYKGLLAVLGDGHYLSKLTDEAVFKLIGYLSGYDNTKLLKVLSENAKKEQARQNLLPGWGLTKDQIRKLDAPILWPVWNEACSTDSADCISFELYLTPNAAAKMINGAAMVVDEGMKLKIEGSLGTTPYTTMQVGGSLDLEVGGDAVVEGLIEATSQKWNVSGNFISTQALIAEEGIVDVSALNIGIAGAVKAKEAVDLNAAQKIAIMSLLERQYSGHQGSYYHVIDKVAKDTSIESSEGKVSAIAGGDIGISGASLKGKGVRIESEEKIYIVPLEVFESVQRWAKRYYYHKESVTNHLSNVESTDEDVEIYAREDVYLSGISAKSKKDIKLVSQEGKLEISDAAGKFYELEFKKKKKWHGSSKRITRTTEEVGVVRSTLNAVGNVLAYGKNGQNWIGGSLYAHATLLQAGTPEHEAHLSMLPSYEEKTFHIKKQRSGFSFKAGGGKLKVWEKSTKGTIQNSGTPMPTIVQVEDKIIGYSGGKWYNLGTEMKGSEIYIDATNIELEAAPGWEAQYTYLNHKGIGVGFTADPDKGELSVGSAITVEKGDMNIFTQTIHQASFVSDFIHLKADTIKDYGVIYEAERMEEHARIIIHGVAQEKLDQTYKHFKFQAGSKVGIKVGGAGKTASGAKGVADADLSRPEGYINAYFSALKAVHGALDVLSTANNVANGAPLLGGWLYASASYSKGEAHSSSEVPTVIKVRDMLASTSDELKLEGTIIQAYRAYLDTKKLSSRPSYQESSYKSKSYNLDIDIPVSGPGTSGVNAGFQVADGKSKLALTAQIYVSDRLVLNVDGHADLKGTYIKAKSIEANFDSLVLESIQDIIDNNGYGMGVGFGKDALSSLSGNVSDRKAHIVSRMSAIMAEEELHLVVANTLRMIGSMIAHAAVRGKDYSDQNNLSMRVGELFIQHLHDYDSGYTLGASVSFAEKKAAKDDNKFTPMFGGAVSSDAEKKSESVVDSAEGTIGAHKAEGESRATIDAKIDLSIERGTMPADLNRDPSKAQEYRQKYDVRPINAYYSGESIDEKIDKLPKKKDGSTDWAEAISNLGKAADRVVGEVLHSVGITPDLKVQDFEIKGYQETPLSKEAHEEEAESPTEEEAQGQKVPKQNPEGHVQSDEESPNDKERVKDWEARLSGIYNDFIEAAKDKPILSRLLSDLSNKEGSTNEDVKESESNGYFDKTVTKIALIWRHLTGEEANSEGKKFIERHKELEERNPKFLSDDTVDNIIDRPLTKISEAFNFFMQKSVENADKGPKFFSDSAVDPLISAAEKVQGYVEDKTTKDQRSALEALTFFTTTTLAAGKVGQVQTTKMALEGEAAASKATTKTPKTASKPTTKPEKTWDLSSHENKKQSFGSEGKKVDKNSDNVLVNKVEPKTTPTSSDPYEIAMNGGKHYGQYIAFLKQSDEQLTKSIKAFKKNILKHERYIDDPLSHVPHWHSLSKKHQSNLIHHWEQDIKRAREFKIIAEQIMSNRMR